MTTFNQNWSPEIGGGGWGNGEAQYYTNNQNINLTNGFLTIQARKESVNGKSYTSARLISKKLFQYGIIEMRAKLPPGRGTWPAFWLLAPGSWPSSGEIDVMEEVGFNPNVIVGTIHCTKYNNGGTPTESASIRINDTFNQFHLYTLLWTNSTIQIAIDNYTYFIYNNPNQGYDSWPFNNFFNIILNLAIGGAWGGIQGIDDSIFPTNYVIDYVRHYSYNG
jgi:beta-glucanase (GH16 family)